MRFLLELPASADLPVMASAARGAQAAGLDGILLSQALGLPTPLLTAAALAPEVPDLRLAVELEVGVRHPFEIAEEAAVVDLVSGGRLVLIARPTRGAEEDFPEALELLQRALSARPFRFEGRRWRVPANLEANAYRIDSQVRMMPAPAQLRMEIWGTGSARDHALACALGYLAGREEDQALLGDAYRAAERSVGLPLIGAIRAQRDQLDSAEALTSRLLAGRRMFGQDLVVVPGGASTAQVLARQVSPRVQLNRLPPGLEQFWATSGDDPPAEI